MDWSHSPAGVDYCAGGVMCRVGRKPGDGRPRACSYLVVSGKLCFVLSVDTSIVSSVAPLYWTGTTWVLTSAPAPGPATPARTAPVFRTRNTDTAYRPGTRWTACFPPVMNDSAEFPAVGSAGSNRM